REIGTIIYSLGCFPSQTDLHDFIAEVLDKEKRGYLEPEELTKYMTQEGELFTQEEMDEMLTALADPEKDLIYYKDVLDQLIIDPEL
ncbi:EF-hand calcium-binding domain-containing protein 2, partial [Nibea albiflora]